MKKKIFIISFIAILICITSYTYYEYNIKNIKEDDIKLAININGTKVDEIPTTGIYTLESYSCDNGSTISWNKFENEIIFKSITTSNESCSINLVSDNSNYLVDMPLGSYVSYTGSNGCPTTEITGTGAAKSKDACSGKNANQNADTSNYTYGYCYSANYKFYTYGWRLAYTLDSDSDGTKEAYIVTAGSPECVAGTEDNSTSTIASLNAKAIKYCNEALAYGGTCQSKYTASNANTWAMNGKDYYNITEQWYGEGRRLYSYDTATENSSGTECYNVYSTKQCGYNSDIIDNGGYYWFGSAYNSSYTLYWYATNRNVRHNSGTGPYGARPVVHLKSTVRVVGGKGTMEEPFIIES
ncbi:MAG: hypothetical protein IJB83_00415 [Bacilli bacterium]|nr:hypothetical protein [Bacilli bacterium]